jgi:hypothetical protein
MSDQIIDVESSEVVEDAEFYVEDVLENIEPPETIEGLEDFSVLAFMEDMQRFEEKYDLEKHEFSIEVFETEDEKKVWQVQSETGTHNFDKYEDLKDCLENTPERLINV